MLNNFYEKVNFPVLNFIIGSELLFINLTFNFWNNLKFTSILGGIKYAP